MGRVGLRFATEAANQLELENVISYHVGSSPTDVPDTVTGHRFDYVYIDGLPTQEQPFYDFRAIAPYLAEKCLIAFRSNRNNNDVAMAVRATEAYLGTSATTYSTLHRLTRVGRGVSLAAPSIAAGRIVIATRDGISVLPRLLHSLMQFGTAGYELLIVDTGTTNKESLNYLEQLRDNGIDVTRTPYDGYDTGGYLWAYRNFPAERYVFLQDSLMVTRPDWIAPFCTEAAVVALAAFNLKFDNAEQPEWLTTQFAARPLRLPYQGIFGPIFAVSHTVLAVLDQHGFLNAIPMCRQEEQAMERGWAIAFATCGIEVQFLVPDYTMLNAVNAGLRKVVV